MRLCHAPTTPPGLRGSSSRYAGACLAQRVGQLWSESIAPALFRASCSRGAARVLRVGARPTQPHPHSCSVGVARPEADGKGSRPRSQATRVGRRFVRVGDPYRPRPAAPPKLTARVLTQPGICLPPPGLRSGPPRLPVRVADVALAAPVLVAVEDRTGGQISLDVVVVVDRMPAPAADGLAHMAPPPPVCLNVVVCRDTRPCVIVRPVLLPTLDSVSHRVGRVLPV